MAVVGSVVLSTATLLASASPEGGSPTLGLGLFLLGLGWSCTLVAGSTMLTAAVPAIERPGAQGASDLVMGLVAGLGGALAGVVVDRASFTVLALAALGVAVVIGLVAALSAVRTHPPPPDSAKMDAGQGDAQAHVAGRSIADCTIAMFFGSLKSITNDLSILIFVMGRSLRYVRDDWPTPKSSIARWRPRRRTL